MANKIQRTTKKRSITVAIQEHLIQAIEAEGLNRSQLVDGLLQGFFEDRAIPLQGAQTPKKYTAKARAQDNELFSEAYREEWRKLRGF